MVAREIGADHYIADFAHLEDVRELASALASGYPHIDVPANNAGGFFSDPAKTEDGSLKTFQVNHLAPFLLTSLLMDRLIASKASVIQTSTFQDLGALMSAAYRW
jgi:NAD(P)-dependent dehydrogenase (short-subunit alcohol dehydrogenase family)